MFQVINKQTRPNVNVAFYIPASNDTQEFKNHMDSTYLSTGKLITFDHNISSNGLELISTTVWSNESSFNEWKNDSVVQENFTAPRNAHNIANGITDEQVSKQTV